MRRTLFGLVVLLVAAAGCGHTASTKSTGPVVEEYPLPPGVK